MYRRLLLAFAFLSIYSLAANAQTYPDPFEYSFISAGGDSVQFELDVPDTLAVDTSLSNGVFYRDPVMDEWQNVTLSEVYSTCSIYTYSATVELETSTALLEWYNRSENDTAVVTESPKNENDGFPVQEHLLADLGADAVGDAEDASGPFLDLTHCHASYSESKLYFRIQNDGGGYPTNSGLNYFGYIVGIVNPDAGDSAAYSLVYADIPFFLSPGLYRLDLTDSSFTNIGSISTSISGDYLSMSCDIADLLAEPGWDTWPPPSGYIGVAPATITQSLSEMTANDFGKTAIYIPRSRTADFIMNTAPNLTDATAEPDLTGVVGFSVTYTDANDHLASVRNLYFESTEHPMTACIKHHDIGTVFETSVVVENTGWYDYYFEFSDGLAVVSTDIDSVFVEVDSYDPGDADGNGSIDIDDIVFLIDYVFGSGPAPDPVEAGDADCSGAVDIDDIVYLIDYVFSGGPAPCEG